jgi:hypothetical protein
VTARHGRVFSDGKSALAAAQMEQRNAAIMMCPHLFTCF